MRKTLQKLCLLPLLSSLAILAGCASGPNISSDIDPLADFTQYRSFAFANPLGTDKAGYTTILTERLKAATRLQMEQRGYVYDEQAPNLLVNFLTQVSNKSEYVPPPPMPWGANYYGYRMGFYGPWAGYQFPPEVIQYTQGVLNIDLIDTNKKQMVWEGVATTVINDIDQASSEAFIAPLVADIFKQYPFVAGSNMQRQSKQ